MRAFPEILRAEALRMGRNFLPMFFALAFPVFLLLVFGGIYGNKPSSVFAGQGTVNASVPAYFALIIAVTELLSFPLTMSEYRGRGILRRLRATPANPFLFLLAQLVVNALLTVAGMALLVIFGVAFFHLHLPHRPGLLVPVLVLSIASTYSIGFLVASLAPNEGAATLIANLVYFPMIFLAGATIPLDLLPHTMRIISYLLPLSYAVNVLKGAWLTGVSTHWAADVAVLLGALVVCVGVSVRVFRWE